MSCRVRAIIVALAFALTLPAAAQQPLFRTSVDLVTIDALVIGGDGRPLADLGLDDFVVHVDGRRRTLASVHFVAAASGTPGSPPLAASHYTSNQQAGSGRYFVIAVDEAHIRRLEGRAALEAAARFLDTLDPADHVAVTGMARIGVLEFSRDRAALKRRLHSLTGHTDPVFLQFNLGLHEAVDVADGNRSRLSDVVLRECGRALTEYTSLARAGDDATGRDACPEQVEQEARAVAQHARTQARISLSGLTALVQTLKGLDGPKTIVLLSEGMIVDPRLVDLGALAAHTRDARAAIYTLHMDTPLFEAAQARISPTFLQDAQARGDGLARVAGAARGAMFALVGGDLRPFTRIVEEQTGYYLLGLEPTDADRDGATHRIDVRLARRSGTVRARAAFRLPPVLPSPRMREEDLVALLRSARPATELPVSVATFVFAEPAAPEVRVVISSETEVAAGAAADALLGYVLVDARGVIAASGAHRVEGGHHAFTTRLAPGSYTLRVGAIDPLGRRGVVQRSFRATVLPQNGVRVSDVVIAPGSAAADTRLDPIVDLVGGEEASAYVELYADSARLTAVRVLFEVRAPESADAVAAVDAIVDRQGDRWAQARAALPLRRLPPGPYVLVGRVLDGEHEVARVTRPFTRSAAR